MPILPKHVYGDGPMRQNPHNNAPIGSGPFRFGEYKPGEYLVLERFDGFFRKGRPYLDKITYNIVPDRAAAALAMQRGDIQYVAYAPFRIADLDRLAADPKLVVGKAGYEGVGALNWLAFNVRQGPLANLKVRQAIAYAIDRDFITQKLQRGRSQPALGPIHPSSPLYDKTLNPYKLDPGARQPAARRGRLRAQGGRHALRAAARFPARRARHLATGRRVPASPARQGGRAGAAAPLAGLPLGRSASPTGTST